MQEVKFPDPNYASTEGLLATGGDLSVDTLVSAYTQGVFPWFNPGHPILWWSPDPRLVLYPTEFKCSRSLRKLIKQGKYNVSANTAFNDVITACATRGKHLAIDDKVPVSLKTEKDDEPITWITEDMHGAYIALHQRNFAHSVEVWEDDRLVGGLYGLQIGKAFFGESMFSVKRDCSKVALAYLAHYCVQHEIDFIDCQIQSEHLISLGARDITRRNFLRGLREAIADPKRQETEKISAAFSDIRAQDVITAA
ncbi:MAG: leucyl/phenylalanyl-tRNA--protein transferase [Pseudomonadota bacterium]